MQTDDGKAQLEQLGEHFPVGLGFTLSTEEDRTNFVQSIKPDSIMAKSGILVDDQIMSINGTCIIGMTHDEVVDELQNQRELRISIERDTSSVNCAVVNVAISRDTEDESWGFVMESMDGASMVIKVHQDSIADHAGLVPGDRMTAITGVKTETLTHPEILSKLQWPVTDVVMSIERQKREGGTLEPNQETMEMKTINIERAAGGSWGFSVESETFTHPSGAIFTRSHVVKVFAESPADKAGILSADLVIAVNEQRLDALQHEDVCALLAAEPTNIKLMIERPRAGPTAVLKQLLITRSETGQPLGFSMSTNTKTGHITTDEVLPCGLADQAGLLPDDRLLSINDAVLHMGLPHNQIVAMLSAQQDVDIVIERLEQAEHGEFEVIRIQVRASEQELKERLSCALESNEDGHHVLTSVGPDSLGARAGLAKGDRLLLVDDVDVCNTSHDEVVGRLGMCYYLTVSRRHTAGSRTPRYMATVKRDSEEETNGIKIQKIEEEDAHGQAITTNKYVVGGLKPQGPAEAAGLEVNDVILAINGVALHDIEELEQVTELTKQHLNTAFTIQRVADDEEDEVGFPGAGDDEQASSVYILDRDDENEMLGFEFETIHEVGAEHECKHIVSNVFPNSAAEDAGLRIGDEILEVNENNTEALEHDPVVAQLKVTLSTQIKIHRHAAAALHRVSWLPAFNQDAGVSYDEEPVSQAYQAEPSNTKIVTLTRESVDESYGFMCGTIDNYPHPRVYTVAEGSIASGKLGVGDIIISINGTFTSAIGEHDEVITLLKENDTSIELEISMDATLLTIDLKRNSYNTPWLIGIGQIGDDSHVVTEVQFGSPAYGLLMPLDKLVAVNETMTTDHNELIQSMISFNDLRIDIERPTEHRRKSISLEDHSAATGVLMVVALTRPDLETPWGITLAEEVHPDNTYSHMVHGTKAGSPCDGQLQIGDQVHTVNGEQVGKQSHNDIVAAISSGTTVVLQVARSEGEHIIPAAMQIVVQLDRKDITQSWGLTLGEMKEDPTADESSHEITHVAPGSVAEGKVFKMDSVHSVNGKLAVDLTHQEMVDEMREATSLTFVLNRLTDASTESFDLTLKRDALTTPWGITLGELVDDSPGAQTVHRVTNLAGGSPATGVLVPHDTILSIDGKPAGEMSHNAVVELLKGVTEVAVSVERTNTEFTYLEHYSTRIVEVSRDSVGTPWGVDLESEPDNSAHTLAAITSMSGFFGKAYVGDDILEIDGASTVGMPHDDVLQLLGGATNVQLRLASGSAADETTAVLRFEGKRDGLNSPWG